MVVSMIPAKDIDGELWIKASDHHQAIKAALEAKDEPVQWGVDWGKDGNSVSIIKRLSDGNIEVLAWEYLPNPPQRTWVSLTPACPKGLTEYECEVEGVDLVCYLEYTPEELGSRDSNGLPNEPDYAETMELVNAYVKGTDVDIGHLLMQGLVDHITTTALEDFKNDNY
jgi:hypothetical protein